MDLVRESSSFKIEFDIDTIISSIASILTEIITENIGEEKKALRDQQMSLPFFSKKIPSISIKSYLERIIKYSKMADTTLILVLIYIDKLCEMNNFLLTSNNVHR